MRKEFVMEEEFEQEELTEMSELSELEALDEQEDVAEEELQDVQAELMSDESAVSAYLKEISKYPVLTAEEELELALRVEQGDAYAKERFYNGNLRLVVSIAKRYCNHGMEFIDLIQEGNIGLMKAVSKFNVHMGYKFSTYATWWIRQGISRALSEQTGIIRKPVHVKEEMYKMNRIFKSLTVELGREPSEQEIARVMKVPVERVRELREYSLDSISLHTPVGEDKDSNFLGDFIKDEKTKDPEEAACDMKLKEDLQEVLLTLTERERQVVLLRYGLAGNEEHTLEEVGKLFNLTRERIRQIEMQAIRKLRNSKNLKRLSGYLTA